MKTIQMHKKLQTICVHRPIYCPHLEALQPLLNIVYSDLELLKHGFFV